MKNVCILSPSPGVPHNIRALLAPFVAVVPKEKLLACVRYSYALALATAINYVANSDGVQSYPVYEIITHNENTLAIRINGYALIANCAVC